MQECRLNFKLAHNMWAPSSEFVSWQISTAHVQPFRGARDLAFCLKVPLDSLLVWASSGGSGETARMRRLTWTFAARIGYKYQIRLTRSKLVKWNELLWIHVYTHYSRDPSLFSLIDSVWSGTRGAVDSQDSENSVKDGKQVGLVLGRKQALLQTELSLVPYWTVAFPRKTAKFWLMLLTDVPSFLSLTCLAYISKFLLCNEKSLTGCYGKCQLFMTRKKQEWKSLQSGAV